MAQTKRSKNIRGRRSVQKALGNIAQSTDDFVNPFNFVRFGKLSRRGHATTHERYEGFSGRLVCDITTETPIFIPDPETAFFKQLDSDEENVHKLMDFFTLDGKPAIPPTSLKGMIRTLCETLSNSCLSKFDDGFAVYRDLRDFAAFQRGSNRGVIDEVQKGVYEIRPVIEIKFPRSIRPGIFKSGLATNDFKEGKRVWVKYIERRFTNDIVEIGLSKSDLTPDGKSEVKEGTIYPYSKGLFGPFGNTRQPSVSWRVVVFDDKKQPIPVPKKVVDQYREMFDNIVSSAKASNRPRAQNYDAAERWWDDLRDQFVYFERECFDHNDNPTGNIISFGKNYRYKWAYSRKERLERIRTGFLPCEHYSQACICCRIFGLVWKEKKGKWEAGGYSGKVSFSAARLLGAPPELKTIKLRILNSPKPSCRQFYLVQQGKYQSGNVTQLNEKTYNYQDAVLRGRKFYWHHPPEDWSYYEICETSDRPEEGRLNSTVRLLPKDQKFRFTVDFENLKPEELGLLLFALDVANQWAGTRHKLGMGKPLGLGTVRIDISEVDEIKRAERYKSLTYQSESSLITREDIKSWMEPFIKAFKDQLERENYPKKFEDAQNPQNVIENIADLQVILSINALPAGTKIIYPGDNPKPNNEFNWFMNHKGQPLEPIQQTRNSSRQRC